MNDIFGKIRNVQLLTVVIVVAAMAAIGALVLKASHAQTPDISVNACSGTLSGGAACQTDSTANGGQAVLFNGSSSTSSGGGAAVNCPAEPVGGPDTCAVSPLFDDEFNGPAGPFFSSSANQATSSDGEWYDLPGCSLNGAACNDLASNATLDGQGHLDLRISWDSSTNSYDGAFIATFPYSYWPPPTKGSAVLTPPYQITMSAEMPNVGTGWPALWLMDVNHSQAQGDNEIDAAEDYGTNTWAGCNQHLWVNGAQATPSDIPAGNTSWGSNGWSCAGENLPSMSTSFHTYTADVYSDHVVYYVDGTVVGTSPHGTVGTDGTVGDQGILLDVNLVSSPGPGQGPWDMLVDYVKVTSLGTIVVN
jgi:glycosyl hydrolase family 16